jgi:hypothetical protein
MFEPSQRKSEPCRLIREAICELERLWGPLAQSVCLQLLEAYELVRQAEKEKESIKEKEKLCDYYNLLTKRNWRVTPRVAAPPVRGDTLLSALLPPKPCKSSSTEKGSSSSERRWI